MKKEFLTGLGIADDVAEKITAEAGRDIEREKAKYADRDELKTQLETATKQIESFKAMKPDELQKQIADLSTKLKTQETDSAKKIAEMETSAKVKDYLSGKKFVNDLTRDAIASKLSTSLSGDDSKGKSLDEIFKGLVADQKNILADENTPTPPTVTPMGQVGANAKNGVEAAFAKLNPNLKL